jgi:GTPase Era involved in 16S rRNA processing
LPAIENSAITGNQRLLQVAVIGQANSGKSSLFNRLASFHYATSTLGDNTDAFALRNGHRPCAASAVSGTTSHLSTIALTRHLPHQLILIDTPSMGSCKPLSLKGRNYKDLSWKAVERADHVLCVIDATGSNHQSKSGHLKPDVVLMLKNLRRAKKPSTLILNKVE